MDRERKARVKNIKIINVWGEKEAAKICIIKTFLVSQFLCILQAPVVPDSVLTQVNRLLFRILWRKRLCVCVCGCVCVCVCARARARVHQNRYRLCVILPWNKCRICDVPQKTYRLCVVRQTINTGGVLCPRIGTSSALYLRLGRSCVL